MLILIYTVTLSWLRASSVLHLPPGTVNQRSAPILSQLPSELRIDILPTSALGNFESTLQNEDDETRAAIDLNAFRDWCTDNALGAQIRGADNVQIGFTRTGGLKITATQPLKVGDEIFYVPPSMCYPATLEAAEELFGGRIGMAQRCKVLAFEAKAAAAQYEARVVTSSVPAPLNH
jgi:hypothetical protein